MSSWEGGEKTTQPGLSPTEGTYGVHLGEPHLALSTCHSRPFLQVPTIGGRCYSKQGEATGEGEATGFQPLSPVTGWCVKASRITSMLHTVLQAMKSTWLILSPRTRWTSFESQGNHGRVLRALGVVNWRNVRDPPVQPLCTDRDFRRCSEEPSWHGQSGRPRIPV